MVMMPRPLERYVNRTNEVQLWSKHLPYLLTIVWGVLLYLDSSWNFCASLPGRWSRSRTKPAEGYSARQNN